MSLSRTSDHAIRAVLFLARQDPELHVPAERIAGGLGAPRNYLAKTLGLLARAGIVDGLRGPTGGFRLAVPPEELAISRIFDAVDEPAARSTCLMGNRPCDAGNPCRAHHLWTALKDRARHPWMATTVADLVAGETPVLTTPTPCSGEEI